MFLCVDTRSGEEVAVKILKQSHSRVQFYSEVSILRRNHGHQGIVTLKEYGEDGLLEFSDGSKETSVRYIITEYLPHSLFDVCSSLGPMGEEAGKFFLNSVVGVLDELHSNGDSHRDLKLENLLLDQHFNIKLIDFGMASQKNISCLQDVCGTHQYMAPEILERKTYQGDKVDIFAIGVILFMVVAGHAPFETEACPSDLYYSQLIRGDRDSFFSLHELDHLSDEC